MDLLLMRCVVEVMASTTQPSPSPSPSCNSNGNGNGNGVSDNNNNNSQSEENSSNGIVATMTQDSSEADSKQMIFDTAQSATLVTLAEAVKYKLAQWCHQSKEFAEHTGRNKVHLMDVITALSTHGVSASSLHRFASDPSNKGHQLEPRKADTELPVPQTMPCVLDDPTLRKEKPAYMPSHLPKYPDPHTFARSPVFEPVYSSYVIWRKDKAAQELDVERALIRIQARRGKMRTFSIRPKTKRLHPVKVHLVRTTRHPSAYCRQGEGFVYVRNDADNDPTASLYNEIEQEQKNAAILSAHITTTASLDE